MQRYAKVPDFIVLSEDQQLITLWSVIYLSEVSRQRHDHQKNNDIFFSYTSFFAFTEKKPSPMWKESA